MKVKICGVTRAEDARLACELGAWAVGLIFTPKSPRVLTLEEGKAVRAVIAPGVLAVGVFLDQPKDFILEAIKACRLDAVQLHGSEPPESCRDFPVPVYKAFSLDQPLPDLSAYQVEGFLLESKKGAWAKARETAKTRRVLLAGGLTPENVRSAASAAAPFAIDVSSGVEERPRVKSAGKLRDFFQAVK